MNANVKKILLFSFTALFSHYPLRAEKKTVGILQTENIGAYSLAAQGFKKTLTSEKRDFNLVDLDGRAPRKVDLILAIGPEATEIAMKSGQGTPIVFAIVADPRKNGFDSRGVTGVSMEVPPRHFFQMLKKILPGARKIGVLYDPTESKNLVQLGGAQAKELGLELIASPVASEPEVHRAMASLGNRIDALWMIPDPTVYTVESTRKILLFALKEKLPVIGFTPQYTKAGTLFSLSCDYEDMGGQAGEMALKILNGGNPEAIPIAPCRAISLSLNLIVAERFGIAIPKDIIAGAGHVYK